MALKIIGAGFGRTGTLSVYTALNELGFPCYHMFEVLKNEENKSHLDFWRNVANTEPSERHDWEQAFSKYTAAADNPACFESLVTLTAIGHLRHPAPQPERGHETGETIWS